MGSGILGGGVIVAFAAALWLIYLVPSWRARSQYMATERNALRLQRTLRMLAETSELPAELKLELAKRHAREQNKVIKRTMAAEKPQVSENVKVAERMRRTRITLWVLTAAAFIGTAAAITLPAMAGAFSVFEVLVAVAATLATAALLALTVSAHRVAARRMRRTETSVPAAAESPVSAPELVDYAEGAEEAADTKGWQPVPVPQALHLQERTLAAQSIATALTIDELRLAAAREAEAEELAQQGVRKLFSGAPALTREAEPVRPAAAEASDEPVELPVRATGTTGSSIDVDAIMRRRRIGKAG